MAFLSCRVLLALANIIKVLVLVVIIAKTTTPQRKSGCIMIPIAIRKIKQAPDASWITPTSDKVCLVAASTVCSPGRCSSSLSTPMRVVVKGWDSLKGLVTACSRRYGWLFSPACFTLSNLFLPEDGIGASELERVSLQLIDIDSMHAPCTVYQYMHTYFILLYSQYILREPSRLLAFSVFEFRQSGFGVRVPKPTTGFHGRAPSTYILWNPVRMNGCKTCVRGLLEGRRKFFCEQFRWPWNGTSVSVSPLYNM